MRPTDRNRLAAHPPVRPPLRVRLHRILVEWPIAITLFCEIFMAFIGVAFVVNIFHRTITPDSPWYDWGAIRLFVFGVLFLVVGLYGAFYRERLTGLIPTFLIVGLALPSAVKEMNVIAIIFYGLFLIGGVTEAHTRRERAVLRARVVHREWTVYVKRDVP